MSFFYQYLTFHDQAGTYRRLGKKRNGPPFQGAGMKWTQFTQMSAAVEPRASCINLDSNYGGSPGHLHTPPLRGVKNCLLLFKICYQLFIFDYKYKETFTNICDVSKIAYVHNSSN